MSACDVTLWPTVVPTQSDTQSCGWLIYRQIWEAGVKINVQRQTCRDRAARQQDASHSDVCF